MRRSLGGSVLCEEEMTQGAGASLISVGSKPRGKAGFPGRGTTGLTLRPVIKRRGCSQSVIADTVVVWTLRRHSCLGLTFILCDQFRLLMFSVVIHVVSFVLLFIRMSHF